jgi:hypothetical protein
MSQVSIVNLLAKERLLLLVVVRLMRHMTYASCSAPTTIITNGGWFGLLGPRNREPDSSNRLYQIHDYLLRNALITLITLSPTFISRVSGCFTSL